MVRRWRCGKAGSRLGRVWFAAAREGLGPVTRPFSVARRLRLRSGEAAAARRLTYRVEDPGSRPGRAPGAGPDGRREPAWTGPVVDAVTLEHVLATHVRHSGHGRMLQWA
jgi:hypothetical protein